MQRFTDLTITAPIDIASQFRAASCAGPGQSPSISARQKTGQRRVREKQRMAAIRIMRAIVSRRLAAA